MARRKVSRTNLVIVYLDFSYRQEHTSTGLFIRFAVTENEHKGEGKLRLINKTLVPVRGETAFSAWIADQVAQEAQENDKRMAERYLAWLSRRERFVVCHVNGFSGKELSFEEIAPKLHKTSEEIKQIYDGAIAKLSKDAREFAEFVERLQLPSAPFRVGPNSVN